MAINGFDIDAFRSNYADLARQYTFVIHLNNPFGTLGTEATKFLVNAKRTLKFKYSKLRISLKKASSRTPLRDLY